MKHFVLENLRVQSRNAVDGMRSRKTEICHLDLTVRENSVVFYLAVIAGIECPQLVGKSSVDFAYDLINSGKKLSEKSLRPLF